MAYIPQVDRGRIDRSTISFCKLNDLGELSYGIMALINNYINNDIGDPDLDKCREILGTLEGVKHDFLNTFILPKCAQDKHDNGDIY